MDLTPNPDAAGFDAERLARIDEHFRSAYVDTGKIAGFQIVVGRHGHVAHRVTAGAPDLESGEPLHDQAIWRWYSMTKPVTGVALLSLVERAKVKLTDPIHRFLPEWRDVKVSVRDGRRHVRFVELDRPISVKHALMHMTGIGPGPKGARLDFAGLVSGKPGRLDPTRDAGRPQRMLATEPLRFQPGSQWFYSWSSDICARLVEVIADEPFGDVPAADDLRSARHGRHRLLGAGVRSAHRVASMYARDRQGDRAGRRPAQARAVPRPTMQSGGGGLVGTIDDYARFCQMLTAGGSLDGARILGRPTVELMRTNHLPGPRRPAPRLRAARRLRRGRLRRQRLRPPGGGRARTGGDRRVGPAGDFMWGGAASTAFWIDPTEDLYAMFMTQILPSGHVRLPRSAALAGVRRDRGLTRSCIGAWHGRRPCRVSRAG